MNGKIRIGIALFVALVNIAIEVLIIKSILKPADGIVAIGVSLVFLLFIILASRKEYKHWEKSTIGNQIVEEGQHIISESSSLTETKQAENIEMKVMPKLHSVAGASDTSQVASFNSSAKDKTARMESEPLSAENVAKTFLASHTTEQVEVGVGRINETLNVKEVLSPMDNIFGRKKEKERTTDCIEELYEIPSVKQYELSESLIEEGSAVSMPEVFFGVSADEPGLLEDFASENFVVAESDETRCFTADVVSVKIILEKILQEISPDSGLICNIKWGQLFGILGTPAGLANKCLNYMVIDNSLVPTLGVAVLDTDESRVSEYWQNTFSQVKWPLLILINGREYSEREISAYVLSVVKNNVNSGVT